MGLGYVRIHITFFSSIEIERRKKKNRKWWPNILCYRFVGIGRCRVKEKWFQLLANVERVYIRTCGFFNWGSILIQLNRREHWRRTRTRHALNSISLLRILVKTLSKSFFFSFTHIDTHTKCFEMTKSRQVCMCVRASVNCDTMMIESHCLIRIVDKVPRANNTKFH